MKVKIPDTTLTRDIKNRALLETDRSKLDEYHMKSKMLNSNKSMQEQINTLKQDMNEIKELLKGLVNK